MDKVLLSDDALAEVVGGNSTENTLRKGDWIKCPHCGSEEPFVSIDGWWCCANANCGKQIKQDVSKELVI